MSMMDGIIDLSQPSLYISAASIIFNPLFWNIAARQQYNNAALTRLLGTSPRNTCYMLAATIFTLGLVRDYLYHTALVNQPTHPLLSPAHPSNKPTFTQYLTSYISRPTPTPTTLTSQLAKPAAYLLFLAGNTLVLSSMYALGLTGTYLGDYFGILMDEPVTGFPFNVTGAPMYWGSLCSFVGTALYYGRPAGLVLSVLVWGCYYVALQFEDPFTEGIYRKREEKEGGGGGGKRGRKNK